MVEVKRTTPNVKLTKSAESISIIKKNPTLKIKKTADTVKVTKGENKVIIKTKLEKLSLVRKSSTIKITTPALQGISGPPAPLSSTLVLYPTTANSDVGGYFRLVTDVSEADYDSPAVDVPTGAISGSDQLLSSLVSDAGLIVGTPGVVNLTIVGNIRKLTGATSTNATFHFHLLKRDALGNEVEIGISDNTRTVTNEIYEEFSASLLFNDGVWLETDRIVFKFYGSKVGGGVDPTYEFQFGGDLPVRAVFPVPVSVLLNDYVQNSFETFNKNLKAYPYEIVETSGTITTITYTTGSGTITKVITEVSPTITTIVLSGIPVGIPTTKTINNGVVTYT